MPVYLPSLRSCYVERAELIFQIDNAGGAPVPVATAVRQEIGSFTAVPTGMLCGGVQLAIWLIFPKYYFKNSFDLLWLQPCLLQTSSGRFKLPAVRH